MSKTFRNPVLSGFYPDPSVCRVGEDYYLVTSTFEYFPGLPIFRSRDLVSWTQLGHVLSRPSQLDLDGIHPSRGLYAPTIRHHDGTFFVTNTLVGNDHDPSAIGQRHERNFIVTATDPAGAWSEPVWLNDAPGIDPSLFFDDDGRAWYTGNRVPPEGPSHRFHKEIYLQELDLGAMQLVGPKYSLWDGAIQGNIHAEAPHLYKINGWYYLLIAEGGTEHDHAVTVARSRNITGPYQGNPRNPILTHRHLGKDHPIACTGHADLVETQHGEWWMFVLATRPYGGYYYNLGRETFLAPVIWEDGWPVVSPGSGRIEFEYPLPDLPADRVSKLPACDNFETGALAPTWSFLRTPRDSFLSLSERPGYLRLRLRPETLSEPVSSSFVGRRQQHSRFAARAALEFAPQGANECAGLVLRQSDHFHFRCVVARAENAQTVARLARRENGVDRLLAEHPIQATRIYLKIEAHGQDYGFFTATEPEAWRPLATHVDGRVLSTNTAGGYVGAFIGMYASSNGERSDTNADFDWFEYLPE